VAQVVVLLLVGQVAQADHALKKKILKL
jgi:hypothetical protein